MASKPDRPAVSIITGWLGAGKTTLLNHVLRDPAYADAAVIINEFGEIALDHLLVTTPGESAVLLENGCICCELRGDLIGTLADLHRKRRDGTIPAFGRVLVETTGLADPVPIVQTLVGDPDVAPLYTVDSVITMVDGVHGESQLDGGAQPVKQAAIADRILLSKPDLAAPEALRRLHGRLTRLNPAAEVHEVQRGIIHPERLFGACIDPAARGASVARWLAAERFHDGEAPRDPHADPAHSHAAPDITAFCVFHDRPVTHAGLLMWLNLLAALRGARLLRVKGLVNVEGEPVVVQAVQTVIHEPVTLERWPDDERRSRLTFITRGMERAEIERTLAALEFQPGSAGVLDPAAYARFAALAGQFR